MSYGRAVKGGFMIFTALALMNSSGGGTTSNGINSGVQDATDRPHQAPVSPPDPDTFRASKLPAGSISQ